MKRQNPLYLGSIHRKMTCWSAWIGLKGLSEHWSRGCPCSKRPTPWPCGRRTSGFESCWGGCKVSSNQLLTVLAAQSCASKAHHRAVLSAGSLWEFHSFAICTSKIKTHKPPRTRVTTAACHLTTTTSFLPPPSDPLTLTPIPARHFNGKSANRPCDLQFSSDEPIARLDI
jgi:hypothetical protein